ncbi:hypothetical protein [Candidatus Endomicrobiellum agilis]|uniref:hypothetical protein n=1 Tax=Candidatus Endomicrobiellum agilis TaxID=3238957 RepID=UPI003572FDA1|nr:hypothetical protein [Endomicrobium sp.]
MPEITMREFIFTVLFSVFIMSSCIVSTAVVKPDYDFSTIRTVRVENFSSGKKYREAGEASRKIFIRHLLAKGYNVVSDNVNVEVDAVIEGSITSFRCERKYVLYPVRCSSQCYIFNDYYDGCYDYNWARSRTLRKVVTRDAAVGIYAYMTDVKTGQVIWSDSSVCKNKNIDYALDAVVRDVLRTIPRDNANKRK